MNASTAIIIRPAGHDDAASIAAIYAHHVLHGTASYELEPPSVAEIEQRMRGVSDGGWPWLVADAEDTILGWACASQFRPRPAYAYACEDSVYVAADAVGRGIGTMLLNALIAAAAKRGARHMVAVIGGAEPASIALHARCGFIEVGRLGNLGWKHGRWLDNVYMQRQLGPGAGSPP